MPTPRKYSSGTTQMSVAMPNDLKWDLDALAELSEIPRNRLIVSAVRKLVESKRTDIEVYKDENK